MTNTGQPDDLARQRADEVVEAIKNRALREVHHEHTREIRDVPPELLERMDAIEAAYRDFLLERQRVKALEVRADQTDERIAALAQAVGGLREAMQLGAGGFSTALTVRIEAIEQHIEAGETLTEAVQALMAALDMLKRSLVHEINGVNRKVEDVRSRLDGVERMSIGFEEAFGAMRRVGQERFR